MKMNKVFSMALLLVGMGVQSEAQQVHGYSFFGATQKLDPKIQFIADPALGSSRCGCTEIIVAGNDSVYVRGVKNQEAANKLRDAINNAADISADGMSMAGELINSLNGSMTNKKANGQRELNEGIEIALDGMDMNYNRLPTKDQVPDVKPTNDQDRVIGVYRVATYSPSAPKR